MFSAIGSALSGLAAADKRIGVSANNIANQFSTKSVVNGQVVNQPYMAQRVDQISITNGGVEVRVRDVNPASVAEFNPASPEADANGTVLVPNVDIATELVNQKIAGYDYKANLKTIKVQDDLTKSLLNILS